MLCLPITEISQVAAARRRVTALAHHLGFQETDAGKVALVVTEVANNLVKHATGGQLLVRQIDTPGAGSIELLALDSGPGMRNVSECLRDNYSTAGSPGTGLGAITRLATFWDVYSLVGMGTALLIRMSHSCNALSAPAGLNVGTITLSKPGEEVCGDGWAIDRRDSRDLIMVVDGLGHGPGAAEAARIAERVVHEHSTCAPAALLEHVHAALRSTRGAAVAIAEVNLRRQEVTFAGVGNIAGTIFMADQTYRMVSYNGIVGHEVRKIRAFTYPWCPEALLVLNSDGLTSRWNFDAYPGLAARHPSLIAGVLYRDFARGRDDVTVVAAKG